MKLPKTGIPLIDEQHKKILEALSAPPSQSAGEEIFKVYDHIMTHFRDEEALMREKEYPSQMIFEHEKEHRHIQEHISLSLEKQGFFLTPAVRSEIKRELFNHIADQDRMLADFIRGRM